MSTAIQWTDETWNCVVGCTTVSSGCDHCYAKELHDKRHKAFQAGKDLHRQYAEPFETVQLMPERLERPLHWRKPRRVFVNSVSDLFHPKVPRDFLARVFAVMAVARRHTYQILTKRPTIMRALLKDPDFAVAMVKRIRELQLSHDVKWLTWPLPNVWLGTSVEHQDAAEKRIPALLDTPAAVRFLSCEPLLGPVDLTRIGEFRGSPLSARVDWVIVGGESGKGARPCHLSWLSQIQEQCRAAGVPLFVKQLGAVAIAGGARLRLRDSKGGAPSEWPEWIRVREFPAGAA